MFVELHRYPDNQVISIERSAVVAYGPLYNIWGDLDESKNSFLLVEGHEKSIRVTEDCDTLKKKLGPMYLDSKYTRLDPANRF